MARTTPTRVIAGMAALRTVAGMSTDPERTHNLFMRHWVLTGLVSGFLFASAIRYARDGQLVLAVCVALIPVLAVGGTLALEYLDRWLTRRGL